jgi:primosomal protein N' (replication factor Y)
MVVGLVAEVALRTVIRAGESAVFSYRVPERLHALVQPGQLVWVPLRAQVVQGVVLRLADPNEAPPAGGMRLRDLHDTADPEAIIPPAGLALAPWLAATYQTTLYEALALLLPPGIAQHAEQTWQATPEGLAASLGALPERERAVLYYVRAHGETTEHDLERNLRGSRQSLREACTLLHERGLLRRSTSLSAPRIRPRRERQARLLVPPAELDAARDSLARAPRQRAIIEALAAASAATLPLPDLYAATGAVFAMVRALQQKGLIALEEYEIRRDPLADTPLTPDDPPPLTPGQLRVWEPLSAALAAAEPVAPFLLHGVTGSGKTEVYLRAVARVLRQGRQAVVLVPEIALTAQLVRRFAARFPGQLAVLHSQLSAGERYDEWRRLRRGEARLAIGSRSAIFAPLPDLGLIIVDEEHEPGYKHDSAPRYHARDVARRLAELTGSVLLLGSATPSIESYHAARRGQMTLLALPERVGGAPRAVGQPAPPPLPLPRVRLVDMRRELQDGNRSIFSQPLQAALAEVLAREEQAILFLNRRGAASFVLCRDCGHVLCCPRCSGSLVLHYTEAEPDAEAVPLLICHSCNQRDMVPPFCPQCLSPRIKSFGIGTQRVEEEVRALFPAARPLRWDRDSATGKGAHERLLDQFLQQEANVLVGTQMIAKGLDLPRVSLVGVVAADTGLYLPDFRSGERTFQLLTQVAGRAGRRTAGAQVVVQTYVPEHYALRAAQEHDYVAFYREEISFRQQAGYPPFSRLVRFVYASSSSAACQRVAGELAALLQAAAQQHGGTDWGIIGPAPAFLQRMRGRWRWHLLLRAADPLPVLAALDAEALRGWTVDVDPVYVL